MNKIRGLSSAQSGMVLSAGQLSDSITTPLVGQISDKIDTRIGKRIPLYMFGTLVVLLCQLPLFDVPFDVAGAVWRMNPEWDENATRTVVQSFCAASMNVGWASVQISHLSLIPQITQVEEKRVKLTGFRQSFSQISTIIVLVLAFCLFQIIDESQIAFQQLVAICVAGIGFGTSVWFVISVNEMPLTKYANANKERYAHQVKSISLVKKVDSQGYMSSNNTDKKVAWQAWFKFPIFYVYGVLYSCGRVALNVSMTLTPFFINQVLQFSVDKSKPINPYIAIIPSVTQAFSTIAGSTYPYLTSKFSTPQIFLCNTILGIISFLGMWLVGSNPAYRDMCQVIYACIGYFSSILLTGSTALINNVIGEQSSSGGVVQAVQSIFEKLANGYLIVTISGQLDGGSVQYINNVNSLIPASCFIISVILVHLNIPQPKFDKSDVQQIDNGSEKNETLNDNDDHIVSKVNDKTTDKSNGNQVNGVRNNNVIN